MKQPRLVSKSFVCFINYNTLTRVLHPAELLKVLVVALLERGRVLDASHVLDEFAITNAACRALVENAVELMPAPARDAMRAGDVEAAAAAAGVDFGIPPLPPRTHTIPKAPAPVATWAFSAPSASSAPPASHVPMDESTPVNAPTPKSSARMYSNIPGRAARKKPATDPIIELSEHPGEPSNLPSTLRPTLPPAVVSPIARREDIFAGIAGRVGPVTRARARAAP